jgi:hypothetical protein
MLFLSAEHRERGSAQQNSFLQRLQKRLHLVYGGRHEWAPWEHNRFSHTKSGGRIWTLLELGLIRKSFFLFREIRN